MKPGDEVKWVQGQGFPCGKVLAVIPAHSGSLFNLLKVHLPGAVPQSYHHDRSRWDRLLVVSKAGRWYSVRTANVSRGLWEAPSDREHRPPAVRTPPPARGLGRPLVPPPSERYEPLAPFYAPPPGVPIRLGKNRKA